MGSGTSKFSFVHANDLRRWECGHIDRAVGRLLRLREEREAAPGHIYHMLVDRREFLDKIFSDETEAADGKFIDLPVHLFRLLDRTRHGRIRVMEAVFLLYLYGGGDVMDRMRSLYRLVDTAREDSGASRYNMETALRVVLDAHMSLGIARRAPEEGELMSVTERAFNSLKLQHATGIPVDDFCTWCTSTEAMIQILGRFALPRKRFQSLMETESGREMLKDALQFLTTSTGAEEEEEEEAKPKKRKGARDIPTRSAAEEKAYREAMRRRAIERATSRDEVERALDRTGLHVSQVHRIRKMFERYADRNGEMGHKNFRLVIAESMPALALDGSADRLFEAFDTDKSGRIDFREFCSGLAIVTDGPLEEKVDLLFSIYDADGNGEINVSELLRFVKTGSERVFAAAQRALERLSALDTHIEGSITAKEFGELAIGLPHLARAITDEIGGRVVREAREKARAAAEFAAQLQAKEEKDSEERESKQKEGGGGMEMTQARPLRAVPSAPILSPTHAVVEEEVIFPSVESLMRPMDCADALLLVAHQMRKIVGRKERAGVTDLHRTSFATLWKLGCGHAYADAEHLGDGRSARSKATVAKYGWLARPVQDLGFPFLEPVDDEDRSLSSAPSLARTYSSGSRRGSGSGGGTDRRTRFLLALEEILEVPILMKRTDTAGHILSTPAPAPSTSLTSGLDGKSETGGSLSREPTTAETPGGTDLTSPAPPTAPAASDGGREPFFSATGDEEAEDGEAGAAARERWKEPVVDRLRQLIPPIADRLVITLAREWPDPRVGTERSRGGVAVAGPDGASASARRSDEADGTLGGLDAPSAMVLKGPRTILDSLLRSTCRTPIEAALAFFRGMDIENSGIVTKREMSKAVLALCTRADAGLDAASRLVIALDVDGDGEISRDEFRAALTRRPELYECFARLLEPQGLSDRQFARLRRRAVRAARGEPSAILYSILGDGKGAEVDREDEEARAAATDLRDEVDGALGLRPRVSLADVATAPVDGGDDDEAHVVGDGEDVLGDPSDPSMLSGGPSGTSGSLSRPGSKLASRADSVPSTGGAPKPPKPSVAFMGIAGVGDTRRPRSQRHVGVSRIFNPVHHRIMRRESVGRLKAITEDLDAREMQLQRVAARLRDAHQDIMARAKQASLRDKIKQIETRTQKRRRK